MKRSELLKYLQELEPEEITDEEITIDEYANEVNIGIDAARARLDRLVSSGMLSKRFAMIEGKKGIVYKKA